MSSGAKVHNPYFYMGADYGLPILIIVAAIIGIMALIGSIMLLSAV